MKNYFTDLFTTIATTTTNNNDLYNGFVFFVMRSEKLMLSNNINDYRIVSQGVTKIPDVDDAAEWVMIDVRLNSPKSVQFYYQFHVYVVSCFSNFFFCNLKIFVNCFNR